MAYMKDRAMVLVATTLTIALLSAYTIVVFQPVSCERFTLPDDMVCQIEIPDAGQ
ncbi:hypothetical protein [Hydrogenophaga crassostreae]|uniref:hypothetical protein n=1 Tax=Hydrogenophaga crassostreae TaxID=1763535 RepID=UPI000AA80D51|nr:hypothetical protein [Hydrogenophaga crassostreae]